MSPTIIYLWKSARLSFHPVCISSADATTKWCALVWKREVPLGASWGRTTARSANQTHSVGYVLECTLYLINFRFSTWGISGLLHSHLLIFCFRTLLHRCVNRCQQGRGRTNTLGDLDCKYETQLITYDSLFCKSMPAAFTKISLNHICPCFDGWYVTLNYINNS